MISNLVSIIIPCYNSESYIDQCLQSLIHQTYQSWEAIVVDDKSMDESVKIVERISNSERRIKLIKNENNIGAAHSRNKALLASKGEYIAFLDSDDYWSNNKLEKQLEFMKANLYDFTYTSYKKVTIDGLVDGTYCSSKKSVTYNDMLKCNYIHCSTVIYKRQEEAIFLMPLYRKRQDWGLWLSILKHIDSAFLFNEPHTFYRSGNDSLSKGKLKLLKYNYIIYRGEGLSKVLSVFYMARFFMYHISKKVRYCGRKKK